MPRIGEGIIIAANAISGARRDARENALDIMLKSQQIQQNKEMFSLNKQLAELNLEKLKRQGQVTEAEFPLLMKQIDAQGKNFDAQQRISEFKLKQEENNILNQMRNTEIAQQLLEKDIVDGILNETAINAQGQIIAAPVNTSGVTEKQQREITLSKQKNAIDISRNTFTTGEIDKNGKVQTSKPADIEELVNTVTVFVDDTKDRTIQESLIKNPLVLKEMQTNPTFRQRIVDEAQKENPDIFGVISSSKDIVETKGYLAKVLDTVTDYAMFPTKQIAKKVYNAINDSSGNQEQPVDKIAQEGNPDDEITATVMIGGEKQKVTLLRKNLLKAKEKYPDLEIE